MEFLAADAQKFAKLMRRNPLGIDPNDPNGAMTFWSSVMVVPVGRPVQLHLRHKM